MRKVNKKLFILLHPGNWVHGGRAAVAAAEDRGRGRAGLAVPAAGVAPHCPAVPRPPLGPAALQ